METKTNTLGVPFQKVVEILKSYQPKLVYRIIKGADHGFKKRESQLARMVASWL